MSHQDEPNGIIVNQILYHNYVVKQDFNGTQPKRKCARVNKIQHGFAVRKFWGAW